MREKESKHKVFCVAPFVNLWYRNSGGYYTMRPCCETRTDGFYWEEKNQETSKQNMFEKYWNSEYIKDIRNSMMENKPHKICTDCINIEKKTGRSHRADYERYLRDNDNSIEMDIEFGNQHKQALTLDYRPSNLCNLKCRMCGPGSSTEWAKEIDNNIDTEYNKLNKMSDGTKVYYFDNDQNRLYDKESNFDDQWKNLPLKHIRRAAFLGGEPLLQNETFEVMSYWAKNNNKNVRIQITTNGTNFTKKWIDLFKQFDNIKIVLSSDGVDDTFDYIRTNANWSKVKENVTELAKLKNIEFVYSYTIQMYNAFNLISILEFLRQWNIEHTYLADFDCHFAERVQQTYLSTALLDNKDRDVIISELETYISKNPEMSRLGKEIMGILIADGDRTVTEAEKKYFSDYTAKLDNVRKTNLIDLDSRFRKYLI
jgi:MoaA/NifB/PqqE/SkfB family radical SAM enzyme